MTTYSITRVSLTNAGVQPNGQIYSAVLSPDGTKVAFVSDATNLVPNDSNGVADLFLKDLVTGAITRVNTDSNGAQQDDNGGIAEGLYTSPYEVPQFSADGTKILFISSATNLVPRPAGGAGPAFRGAYIKTLSGPGAGAIELVSTFKDGSENNGGNIDAAALSPDGRKVALTTSADLVNSDINSLQVAQVRIYIRDLDTGVIRLATANAAGDPPNTVVRHAVFSPDGTTLLFHTLASNLVPGDTNGREDFFLKDASSTTGAITRISTTLAGDQGSAAGSTLTQGLPSFSRDGTKVAFQSGLTDLVSGDTNVQTDLFIKTISGPNAGQIVRISTSSTGGEANGASLQPANFSPDGTKVAFVSQAANLVAGDSNGTTDVFIKDLVTGATTLVGGLNGVFGNGVSRAPQFTADGNHVLFLSAATNLVTGDTNGFSDIFLARVTPYPAPPSPSDPASAAPPPSAAPTVARNFASVLGYANTPANPLPLTVITPTGQVLPNPLLEQQKAIAALIAKVDAGTLTLKGAQDIIVDMADATTSAAAMSYQFFTGGLPTRDGLAYLVNSPLNPNDLNDGYYAGMSAENRYINFAVNLGKAGEGRETFNANYGALSVEGVAAKAYLEIFGKTADAAKLGAILTPERIAYFNALGGDALGAKAAMVGFFLSEAARTDTGPYAVQNENFLYDLMDGNAAFGASAGIYLNAGPTSVGLVGMALDAGV